MKREYVRQVLECASPLALFGSGLLSPKQQRAAAVQDAAARSQVHFKFAHET
jgi:hypothetical protein